MEEETIKEGDTFVYGTAGCVQRVYRVGEIHPTVDLIPCTEVRLINASPLAKVSMRGYTYFTSEGILDCIRKNGRGEQ